MAATFDVGGPSMMKSIGHFVGQRIATGLIALPSSHHSHRSEEEGRSSLCGQEGALRDISRSGSGGGGGDGSSGDGEVNETKELGVRCSQEHNTNSNSQQDEDDDELKDILSVLSSHTNTWRSAIHGVMWGAVQRIHQQQQQLELDHHTTGTVKSTNQNGGDINSSKGKNARVVSGGGKGTDDDDNDGNDADENNNEEEEDFHLKWDFVLSEDACGAYVEKNPFFFTSCLHGFG